MKKVLVTLLSLLLVVGSFFMFAPEDRINYAKEAWRRIQKDDAQLCLDIARKELKDPESARLISLEKVTYKEDKSRAGTYLLRYKAKNSYGAYVIGEEYFQYNLINNQWQIDSLYKLTQDLKRQNKELEERIKERKARN